MTATSELHRPDIVRIGIGDWHKPFSHLDPHYTSRFSYGRFNRDFVLETGGDLPDLGFRVFFGLLEELEASLPESKGKIILYLNTLEGELEKTGLAEDHQEAIISGGKAAYTQIKKRIAPEYERFVNSLQLRGRLGEGFTFQATPQVYLAQKSFLLFNRFTWNSSDNDFPAALPFDEHQLPSVPELELSFALGGRTSIDAIFT